MGAPRVWQAVAAKSARAVQDIILRQLKNSLKYHESMGRTVPLNRMKPNARFHSPALRGTSGEGVGGRGHP
jgi:hypothetical protein